MDPDAALHELLRLADRVTLYIHHRGEPLPPDDVVRMAELIYTLHDWLSAGGFLPRSWAFGRSPR